MQKQTQNIVLKGSAKLPFAFANFTARNEVHVEAEFHAATGTPGCEVHIYTAPVSIDCSEIGASGLNFRTTNSGNSGSDKSLELTFRKSSDNLVSVYPNPNTGYFTVAYYGNSNEVKEITVFDILGNLILKTVLPGTSTVLDLSGSPKGIYFLCLNDKSNLFYKKIIIQ